MLHGPGTRDYLQILPGRRFRWTPSLTAGRNSAYKHFQYVEGVVHWKGKLHFVTKFDKKLFTLDLNRKTYTVRSTSSFKFAGQPDQLNPHADGFMYFTEGRFFGLINSAVFDVVK